MKEYKYKIDGKEYVVAIGEIVNNVADVTVNGEIFSVEMEAGKRVERGEGTAARRDYLD